MQPAGNFQKLYLTLQNSSMVDTRLWIENDENDTLIVRAKIQFTVPTEFEICAVPVLINNK